MSIPIYVRYKGKAVIVDAEPHEKVGGVLKVVTDYYKQRAKDIGLMVRSREGLLNRGMTIERLLTLHGEIGVLNLELIDVAKS